MEVIYRSTRSNGAPVTASQAILKGLAGQESESAVNRAEELRKQIQWIEEAQHEMQ